VRKSLWGSLIPLLIAGVIVALDQWTKALLRSQLAPGESWSPWEWLSPYLQIVHTQNTGAAFSLGQGLGPLFAVLAVGVCAAILFYLPRLPSRDLLLRIALGLLLGGASGNLIDRILYGQVTDFIAIRFFAIVNLADISITAGAVILFLWLWIKDRQERKAAPPPQV
jgi:signal peptidase II